MKNNPVSKAFWRLCTPLLIYWLVRFVAELIIYFVIVIIKAEEIAPLVYTGSVMTEEQMLASGEAIVKIMSDFVTKYQVECMTVLAACTIPVMAFMFFADRRRERKIGIIQNRLAPAGKYVWIVGIGIAVCLGANSLAGLSQLAFADLSYQETSAALYAPSFPVQLLCTGLIIPLSEELLYRGMIFKRMRENGGFWQAALCSTLLFSVNHINLTQLLYTLGLGILLAYAYEKYGSFKAPLILHIVVNLVSLVCTEYGVLNWLAADRLRMAVAAIVCAFAGAVVFVQIRKIEEKPDMPENTDGNPEVLE